MADPPYQSLYRRYRPQRFSEVRGQDHVTRALRNAVAEHRVAHAYLFSGPRGTGKTSTARILAMALNCEAPDGGEPCGRCEACLEVARGSSLDVHELDAASNNGVEAMRDLVARAALGTPGRWKVYIVDEVHMLSTAASNALLKTLEEPPAHVVFVLATTDPQKVLPTIRSRTQHFEFRLLGPELLAELLSDVGADAGLDLPPRAVDVAVRKGNGSARDALSVLDQVAVAGAVDDEVPVVDELVEAVCARDAGRALRALAEAVSAGRGAERTAADLVERLRQGFLATMAPDLVSLAGPERDRVGDQARRLGLAKLVRSMEVIGKAQVEMRDSLDPRLALEVALVRITNPQADDSPAALAERIEDLERRLDERDPLVRDFGSRPPVSAPAPARDRPPQARPRRADTPPGEGPPGEGEREGPAAEARAALGAIRARGTKAPSSPPPGVSGPAQSGPTTHGVAVSPGEGEGARTMTVERAAPPLEEDGPVARDLEAGPLEASQPARHLETGQPARPSRAARTERLEQETPGGQDGAIARDELVKAWGDHILDTLTGRARALFRAGRFLASSDGSVLFALPDKTHVSYCEECKSTAEDAIGAYFSKKVDLRLVVDDNSCAPPPRSAAGTSASAEAATTSDLAPVADAPAGSGPAPGANLNGPAPGVPSIEERLLEMFPGAEEVDT